MKLKLNKQVLKSKLTLFYVIAGIFGLGFSSVAATAVPFESRIMAANVTAGDTQYYNEGVAAKSGDVVKIQVYYHNKAAADSGRVANNVNVKFTMPDSTLKTTNNVSSRVSGADINTITDSTAITTSIPAKLEYIPGTAYRKYNSGTNAAPNITETKISDSVVTGSGYVIPKINPCWNFEETITIQARVLAPAITIDKFVRVLGQTEYKRDMVANPGDTLEYKFEIKNIGSTNLNNVIVKDLMPTGIAYVPGSVTLKNASHPNGLALNDSLFSNGILIGAYTPGSNAIVKFKAIAPKTTPSTCNITKSYTNKAHVKANELTEKFNNAITRITFGPCIETQTIGSITALKFEDLNGNGVKDNNETGIENWEIRLTDSGNKVVTKKTGHDGFVDFTDLKLGSYTVAEVQQTGWVNTTPLVQNVTLSEANPGQEVKFGNKKVAPEDPKDPDVTPVSATVINTTTGGKLATSGPAEAAAGAFGTVSLGGAAYAWMKSKKALLMALKKY